MAIIAEGCGKSTRVGMVLVTKKNSGLGNQISISWIVKFI
jgi:hypothetical protein